MSFFGFFKKIYKFVSRENPNVKIECKHYSKFDDNLGVWDKIQIVRHPSRPHGLDYINDIFDDFFELKGDRFNENDDAIIGGLAKLENQPVMVIVHERGHDIETRLKHNFGMGNVHGYKKACRLMETANELKIPIVTLIDTSGAYPGASSEEKGQGYVLAKCLELSSSLDVPNLSVIIGEGGSGGAISLALSNVVLMLQNSVYSVISPEGCAAILWKDQSYKEKAALAQKLTAQDLYKFGMIDDIVPEPDGGAHKSIEFTMSEVKKYITSNIHNLMNQFHDNPHSIKKSRRSKFLNMGIEYEN